jgi:hypothetical protein
MDWFIGHIIGDYLLQTDWMAMNKKKKGLSGLIPCFVHCLLYTIAVVIATGWYDNVLKVILVFLSHIILDRTYLAVKYMTLLGSFKRIISDKDNPHALWCYLIIDNTWHLFFLWLISKI